MPRKKRKDKYKILSIILAAIIVLLSIYIALPKHVPAELLPLISPELSTFGFEKVASVDARVIGNEGIVTLTTTCYELVAGVEATQAFSIQDALQKKVAERPNAHDIARDVFNTLDIKVLMVKITEIRNGAYFAKIFLRQGNTLLNFDVRPSDGVAIALRVESPIYVNRALLERQGKYIC